MAELAPERASSRDVKGLADRIHDVQGPEIDMMNRWLSEQLGRRRWTRPPPEHGHAAASMPGMADAGPAPRAGERRGADFDKLFLQLMIAHHEGAITMADDVRASGRGRPGAGDRRRHRGRADRRDPPHAGWLNG